MSTIDWPRERKKRIYAWHFESERVVSFPLARCPVAGVLVQDGPEEGLSGWVRYLVCCDCLLWSLVCDLVVMPMAVKKDSGQQRKALLPQIWPARVA